MFSTPQSSAQRAYAHARANTDFRFPGRQPNPLRAGGGGVGDGPSTVQRRQRGFASSFGDPSGVTPGSSMIDRPNTTSVSANGRRQRAAVGQRRPMSLAEMGNFIRTQPGGRAFMEDSDRMQGGRLNFEQSLSRVGAGMARNGQLPPELQQMAIPFKPSAGARQRLEQQRAQWLNAGAQRDQRPKSWHQTQQASFIEQVRGQEQQERFERSQAARQQRELESVVGMGVPFRRSTSAAPQQQRQQQQEQPPSRTAANASGEGDNAAQSKPLSTLRVRRPPAAAVRVTSVPAKQALQANVADAAAPKPKAAVADIDFIERMRSVPSGASNKAAACADGSCPTAHIADPLKSTASAVFRATGSTAAKSVSWSDHQPVNDSQEDDAAPIDVADEQPSALFADSVAEIQASVQKAAARSSHGSSAPTPGGKDAAFELPTLPVSQTKRRVPQPEIVPLRVADGENNNDGQYLSANAERD